MRILVTGASGLLGRCVAAGLLSGGHEIVTFQRSRSQVPGVLDLQGSVTDAAAVHSAVRGIDAIVHLAAKVSLAGARAQFDAINVMGTRTLVDAASAEGVKRFVMVSSPSVAGDGASIIGDDARPADPQRARGDYARTKASAELIALEADSPGLQVVAVRPHLVWGPGDTQLVARIVDRARRGRLPLLGSGAALIDTTYSETAASGIIAALEQIEHVHGNRYVITNGEPRPVAEMIAGICRSAGVKPPAWRIPAGLARAAGSVIEVAWRIRPGTDEPPMTRFLAEQLSTSHWFDQRRTRADLRWEPPVTLDEGLVRLAAFYGVTPSSRSRPSSARVEAMEPRRLD